MTLWFFVVFAYYALCTFAAHRSVDAPRAYHDTDEYFLAAAAPLLSRDIWAGIRAPFAVLVFKLAENGNRLRVCLELSSFLSWTVLASAVAYRSTTRVARAVGILLVFSLAASHGVMLWNQVLLSESISLSVAALFLAAALMFSSSRKVWGVPLCGFAFALALVRDSNAYLVGLFGIVALISAIPALVRRRFAPAAVFGTIGVTFLAAFFLSALSADLGARWQYPMGNVVMTRILRNSEVKAEFERLGMPHVSDALKPEGRRAYANPRLTQLREWAQTRGKAAYEHYLLTHPGYLVLRPASGASLSLGYQLLGYRAEGFAPLEPSVVERFWSNENWGSRAIVVAGLAVASITWRRLRGSRFARLGALLAVLAYPHFMVVYHGDPFEPWRHSLLVNLQIDLALLLLVLALLDALGGRHLEPSHHRAALAKPGSAIPIQSE